MYIAKNKAVHYHRYLTCKLRVSNR